MQVVNPKVLYRDYTIWPSCTGLIDKLGLHKAAWSNKPGLDL